MNPNLWQNHAGSETSLKMWKARGITAQRFTKGTGVLPAQRPVSTEPLPQRQCRKGLRLQHLVFVVNSSSQHNWYSSVVACRTATLCTSTCIKSKIHSGSQGFVFWTNYNAMGSAPYMYLLC